MDMFRITAVGDIMLGDQFVCFGFGIRSLYKGNYNKLIKNKDILQVLKDADLICGNLESSYENSEKLKFDTNVICINKEALNYLRKVGFNLFNLANNHTLGVYITQDLKIYVKFYHVAFLR